ncbi:iron-sulfur cluster-binding domain-containing protein [Dongshaea marina]|uniref:iron-sulfur cluster-binding domain-containing protein n=1 Tax=Dongshaea marina TaxID=2047966 RepID=UPI000D3E34F4|nr:iron-sulfur cluster-binding domain-containing protein [Dongshaea marina]
MQRFELTCLNRTQLTPDLFSLEFESNAPVSFAAGQALMLKVPTSQGEAMRCYSPSCAADNGSRLSLTIKAIEGGLVSNWLRSELAIGQTLEAQGPFGDFMLSEPPGAKVLLLSAGSGIAPIHSIYQTLINKYPMVDIVLCHSARRAAERPFIEELEQACEEGLLTLYWALSQEAPRFHHWIEGRIDAPKLHQRIPDLLTRQIYLCGPDGYLDDLRSGLLASGVHPDAIFLESFTPQQAPKLFAEQSETAFEITLSPQGIKLPMVAGQTVLEAMEAAEYPIMAACRSGVCGSCKISRSQGEIEQSSTSTLTESELAEGALLACSCRVKSDLKIEI